MEVFVIRGTDRVTFTDGVELHENAIIDNVLGASYPLSPSATWALELLRDGRDVTSAAMVLAADASVHPARADHDLRALVKQLNGAWLVNIRPSNRLLDALTRPWVYRRYELPARSPWGLVLNVAGVVARAHWPLWLTVAAVTALLSLALPAAASAAVTLAVGSAASLIAHESGHALAARRWTAGCFMASSLASGVSVVHPIGARDHWIAAAGPLAAVVTGLVILLALWPLQPMWAVIAAVPFTFHAVGGVILFSDGRRLAAGAQ